MEDNITSSANGSDPAEAGRESADSGPAANGSLIRDRGRCDAPENATPAPETVTGPTATFGGDNGMSGGAGLVCDGGPGVSPAQLENIGEDGGGENGVGIFTLPIVSATDLMKMELEEPPPLVHGLLHSGEKMIFQAGSKAGKTWAAIEVGVAVATGTPFWGVPTVQSPVLMVNLEISEYRMQERLSMISESKSIGCAPDLHLSNLRGCRKDIEEILFPLITAVKRLGAGLVIVDPVYKLMPAGGSENADETIRRFVGCLDLITEETGAAIMFSHHHPKGNMSGRDALDRGSGSGVWGRDCDVMVDLVRHDQEYCYIVSNVQRNRRSLDPFVVERRGVVFEKRDDLSAGDIRKANGGSTCKYSVDDILSALDRGVPLGRGEWFSRTDMAKGTFNKLVKEVLDSGAVVQLEKRGRYALARDEDAPRLSLPSTSCPEGPVE